MRRMFADRVRFVRSCGRKLLFVPFIQCFSGGIKKHICRCFRIRRLYDP